MDDRGRLLAAAAVGAAASAAVAYALSKRRSRPRKRRSGFGGLVGDSKLIEVRSLSELTGMRILAKAEFLNPGGSVKDRVAEAILDAAERQGLKVGGTVFEGTSGSTGISLALACQSRGYQCHIFMPDDMAQEKVDLIRSVGAKVTLVRPVSIAHPDHYVNIARRTAKKEGGYFADQFENLANFRTHYENTGREILEQTNFAVTGFVSAAGTGGTIGGVSARLKEHSPSIKTVLVDPPGSALARRVQSGVIYNDFDAEGHRVKHPCDTITEGVGLNRLTRNFEAGLPFVDAAFNATDYEAVCMAHHLLYKDGLFVGSSGALNMVGVIKAFQSGVFQKGDTVVTILCDGGYRHLSKFWNPEFLEKQGLLPPFSRDGDRSLMPSPLEFVVDPQMTEKVQEG